VSRDRPFQQALKVGYEVGVSKRASASLRRPKRPESFIVQIGLEQRGKIVHPVQHRHDRDEFVVPPRQMGIGIMSPYSPAYDR
jgi:hypothetical protein